MSISSYSPRQCAWILNVRLPMAGFCRAGRRLSHKLRGRQGRRLQRVGLPAVSWRDCVRQRETKLYCPGKANGNVRLEELAILNLLAADCEPGDAIFEIGTFDGRTTLNLALSSHASVPVYTLDLLPDTDTAHALDPGERHMVDKPQPGTRLEKAMQQNPALAARITQLYGDSALFDFSPYRQSCGMVFIDASHTFEYVLSDTHAALAMSRPGGVIVWHDYGIWAGVTRALETLRESDGLDIVNIRGTSLAYLTCPAQHPAS